MTDLTFRATHAMASDRGLSLVAFDNTGQIVRVERLTDEVPLWTHAEDILHAQGYALAGPWQRERDGLPVHLTPEGGLAEAVHRTDELALVAEVRYVAVDQIHRCRYCHETGVPRTALQTPDDWLLLLADHLCMDAPDGYSLGPVIAVLGESSTDEDRLTLLGSRGFEVDPTRHVGGDTGARWSPLGITWPIRPCEHPELAEEEREALRAELVEYLGYDPAEEEREALQSQMAEHIGEDRAEGYVDSLRDELAKYQGR